MLRYLRGKAAFAGVTILPFALLLSSCTGSGSVATRQTIEAIQSGERLSLYSRILDDSRYIRVRVPDHIDSLRNAPGVMYITDGQWDFEHVAGLVAYLERTDRIAPLIVVGIEQVDRARELTPHGSEDDLSSYPTGGGADEFLSFIKEELIPYIEKHYRTGKFRILAGHSFGGLFSAYTFVEKPELFDAYLMASPSFWWRGGEILDSLSKSVSRYDGQSVSIHFSVGGFEPEMKTDTDLLMQKLTDTESPSVRWSYRILDQEGHRSTAHQTYYDGLSFVFDGYPSDHALEAFNDGGLPAVHALSSKLSLRLRQPVRASDEVLAEIIASYFKAGKLDEMEETMDLAVHWYPASVPLLQARAAGYRMVNQSQAAEEYTRIIRQLEPASSSVAEGSANSRPPVSDYIPDLRILELLAGRYTSIGSGEIRLEKREESLVVKSGLCAGRQIKFATAVHFFLECKDGFGYFELPIAGEAPRMSIRLDGKWFHGDKLEIE